MNIALTDDLKELLRRKVANGQFPDEEAVVKEASRQFLTRATSQGHPLTSHTLELDQERLPGPFLEDETVLAPVDLPRPGQALARTAGHSAKGIRIESLGSSLHVQDSPELRASGGRKRYARIVVSWPKLARWIEGGLYDKGKPLGGVRLLNFPILPATLSFSDNKVWA